MGGSGVSACRFAAAGISVVDPDLSNLDRGAGVGVRGCGILLYLDGDMECRTSEACQCRRVSYTGRQPIGGCLEGMEVRGGGV